MRLRAWWIAMCVAGVAVHAGAVSATNTVIFDDFDTESVTSDFRIDFLGAAPGADLDGAGGFSSWTKFCYRVTALQDTTTSPGEFTHLGFEIPDAEPYNSALTEIKNSMSVSANDADYSKTLRDPKGGPLPIRGVEWNNVDDHIVTQGENADFCFTTPSAGVGPVQVGMKVGSVRQFAYIFGPAGPSKSTPVASAAALLILCAGLFAVTVRQLHRRRHASQPAR